MPKSQTSKIFLTIWILMLINFIFSILFQVLIRLNTDLFFEYHHNYEPNEPNFIFIISLILINLISLIIFILFIVVLVLSAKNLSSSSTKTIAITTSIMGLSVSFVSGLLSVIYLRIGVPTLATIILGVVSIVVFIMTIISWAKVKNHVISPSNESSNYNNAANKDNFSFENKIRSLDKLFKDSLITELEFKKAKKDILDKVSEV